MVTICGIIGYQGTITSQGELDTIKKVMIESRIRGRHASGIAWSANHQVHSIVKPVSIDQLVEEIDLASMVENNMLSMIAHARYSTSNIKYNQPIVGDEFAVVHNGVITQADPSTWKDTYGYDCVTENDSELLLRCIESGSDPYTVFPESSIAALVLDSKGKLLSLRNGLRPLWVGRMPGGIVFASTYDILRRAGVTDAEIIMSDTLKDLQRRNWTLWGNHKKKA